MFHKAVNSEFLTRSVDDFVAIKIIEARFFVILNPAMVDLNIFKAYLVINEFNESLSKFFLQTLESMALEASDARVTL
jgi:hypothetical protein